MANMNDDDGGEKLPNGPLRRVAAAFTEQEIEAIDNWGFEQRIRDRTTVLRRLVSRALHQQELEAPSHC